MKKLNVILIVTLALIMGSCENETVVKDMDSQSVNLQEKKVNPHPTCKLNGVDKLDYTMILTNTKGNEKRFPVTMKISSTKNLMNPNALQTSVGEVEVRISPEQRKQNFYKVGIKSFKLRSKRKTRKTLSVTGGYEDINHSFPILKGKVAKANNKINIVQNVRKQDRLNLVGVAFIVTTNVKNCKI